MALDVIQFLNHTKSSARISHKSYVLSHVLPLKHKYQPFPNMTLSQVLPADQNSLDPYISANTSLTQPILALYLTLSQLVFSRSDRSFQSSLLPLQAVLLQFQSVHNALHQANIKANLTLAKEPLHAPHRKLQGTALPNIFASRKLDLGFYSSLSFIQFLVQGTIPAFLLSPHQILTMRNLKNPEEFISLYKQNLKQNQRLNQH